MSDLEIPTHQEMFNRAWNGLKSQGWRQARRIHGACVYQTEDGRRCAWGWVDTSLTDQGGGVYSLRSSRIGIAARLSSDDLEFASALQAAHDGSGSGGAVYNPSELEQRFREFAHFYKLEIPNG